MREFHTWPVWNRSDKNRYCTENKWGLVPYRCLPGPGLALEEIALVKEEEKDRKEKWASRTSPSFPSWQIVCLHLVAVAGGGGGEAGCNGRKRREEESLEVWGLSLLLLALGSFGMRSGGSQREEGNPFSSLLLFIAHAREEEDWGGKRPPPILSQRHSKKRR